MYSIFFAQNIEQITEILEQLKHGREDAVLEAKCMNVLDFELQHSIGRACTVRVTTTHNINMKYGLIWHNHYGLLMMGMLGVCGYIAQTNSYYIELNGQSSDLAKNIDAIRKNYSYHRRFIKDPNDKWFLSNLLINRCSGDVSLLDRYHSVHPKSIESFFAATLKCEQLRDAVSSVICRFHANWKIEDHGSKPICLLMEVSLDMDSIEKALPAVGASFGSYQVEHLSPVEYKNDHYDIKSHYKLQYKVDIKFIMDLSWKFEISRKETCIVQLIIPIADNISIMQHDEVDIYCDLHEETLSIPTWQATEAYRIRKYVLYMNALYECIKTYDQTDIQEKHRPIAEQTSEFWKFIRYIDEQFDDQISVYVDKNERLLKDILYILEQFSDYYTNIFKISITLPITSENLQLHIGDCIDLSNYSFDRIGNIGYIEKIMFISNAQSEHMYVEIIAKAALHVNVDVDVIDGKTHKCFRYTDISDQYPADIKQQVSMMQKEPAAQRVGNKLSLIDHNAGLSNKIMMQVLYLGDHIHEEQNK